MVDVDEDSKGYGWIEMVEVIDYETARQLVLADLRATMKTLPVAERERPRYMINMKSYSILDLIAIIERDTTEGKKQVFDRVKYLGYLVK